MCADALLCRSTRKYVFWRVLFGTVFPLIESMSGKDGCGGSRRGIDMGQRYFSAMPAVELEAAEKEGVQWCRWVEIMAQEVEW